MFLLTLLLACPNATDTAGADSAGGDPDSGVTDDRDGDGVPDSADCLPDDANAYPGHYEVPYNGKDDDCADGDLTDVDGDGYVGDHGGGDDCDDSNPDINPGEIEHCYDSLDNNCDGWFDDSDCDGDGYDISHDCWDDEEAEFSNGGGLTAAEVHPGAEDVWYDGTDADCAGNDDFDQDADGASALDYGGTDCDDGNPVINPAMDEVWNHLDDDCDGVADTLVPGQASMKVTGDTGHAEAAFGAAVVFLPDADGDGREDLVVGMPDTSDSLGGVWVLPTPDGIVTPATEALGFLTGTGGTGAGLAFTTVTGRTQLAVSSPWDASFGSVAFYDTAAIADGAATATITQSAAGTVVALDDARLYVACTAGAVDLAVSTWSSVSGNLSQTDAPFSLYSASHACADAGTFGDMDGDGYDELFVSGTDSTGKIQLYLADSSLNVSGGALSLDDLDHLGAYADGFLFDHLPDITGDGYTEAVFVNPAADALSTGDGRAWIVDGDDFSGAWAAAAFATVSGGTSGASLRSGTLGDLDADGTEDLSVGLAGLGRVEFVPVASLLAGGDVVPAPGSPTFYDSVGSDLFGSTVWTHDVDHDGLDDLLVRTDKNAGGLQLYMQQ
jgi:hypothetical protein